MTSAEDNDPRKIWQSQVGGDPPMTLEQIRRKAEIDAKTRQQWMANTLIAVILTACCAWGIWVHQDGVQRAGLALAIVWSWIAQHSTITQMIAPGLAGEAALSTGLEFYRRELQRRKNYFRSPWLWFLGPVLLAIVFYTLPVHRSALRNPAIMRNSIPFNVLMALWIVFFLVKMCREYLTTKKIIYGLSVLEGKKG